VKPGGIEKDDEELDEPVPDLLSTGVVLEQEPGPGVEVEPEVELSWFAGMLEGTESHVITRPERPRGPDELPLPPGEPPAPPPVVPATSRLVDAGRIARGGMAQIHKVYDKNIRRHVALKRVDPGIVGVLQDATQLLVEEAQITGQLDHPNIVPVYDLGSAPDGMPMFTMKLVRGHTLTELIRSARRRGHAPIALRALIEILLKVCDALAFAHSRGVIHRDLKPDNVMIGSHGQVYVMDWGCALVVARARDEEPVAVSESASRRAMPNMVMGTAAYMSPEQARGAVGKIDARTDVYGMGAILYQILTRKPPHLGVTFVESLKVAQAGAIAPPEQVRPGLDMPRPLVQITMKALAADPDERHQTIEELRADLERFIHGLGWFPQKRLPPGSVIIAEGEPGDIAYVIESGTCEVSRLVGGVPTVMRRMGAGEVFGEAAIITSQPRSATVTAVDEVVVTEVNREALEREVGGDSWIGSFLRCLAGRFRDTELRRDREARGQRIHDALRVQLALAGAEELPWPPLRRALAEGLGLPEDAIDEVVADSDAVVVEGEVVRKRPQG
jgi:serine/threonine-protein kinase